MSECLNQDICFCCGQRTENPEKRPDVLIRFLPKKHALPRPHCGVSGTDRHPDSWDGKRTKIFTVPLIPPST